MTLKVSFKKCRPTMYFFCMILTLIFLLSYLSVVNITKIDSVKDFQNTPSQINNAGGKIDSKENLESLSLNNNNQNIHVLHIESQRPEGLGDQQKIMQTNEILQETKLIHDQNVKNIITISSTLASSEIVNNNLRGSISEYKEPELLSFERPVTASVRGNLGLPNVVTNENIENWLEDRWQAAKDMTGKPIPGEHWLEIDLQRTCMIDRIFIDWEIAYSNDYTVVGRAYKDSVDDLGSRSLIEYWVELGGSKNMRTLGSDKKHILHDITVNTQIPIYPMKKSILKNVDKKPLKLISLPPIRFVRLIIHSPATEWGSSVWRFQVYGTG